LAAQSLAAVGEDFVLNISHMGYVTALLDALAIPASLRGEAMAALRSKNESALVAVAKQAQCGADAEKVLAQLVRVCAPLAEALPVARAMAQGYSALLEPLQELEQLYATLEAVGQAQHLCLDFSVLNHIDYYNGLVFKGYIKGVPRAVLAGGRYDNLLRCMGKPQAALGFALYLGELERALRTVTDYDVDTLLLYAPNQSPALVAQAVQALLAQGGSVRAAAVAPAGLRPKRVLRLQENGEWEVMAVC
jgi:ATP phosphoribosyltransferase regulatory subunit